MFKEKKITALPVLIVIAAVLLVLVLLLEPKEAGVEAEATVTPETTAATVVTEPYDDYTAAEDPLEKLELFDVYRGAQVAEGKKSVAFSLSLRAADHTLTDKEADEIIQNILKALETDCGAVLRA